MSDQKLTAMSVFMDGEADEDQVDVIINDLIHEESMRGAWTRYHMISDCLQHRLPARVDPSLANRISSAIRHEPTVLAPVAPAARAFVKPLAGLAVAASVAALAIFGIQHTQSPATAPVQADVASNYTTAPVPTSPHQFTFTSGHAAVRAGVPVSRMSPTLNRYLVNYNESRTNAAVQGMFPYVRIVAHDDNE